jgi:hypothetical protein
LIWQPRRELRAARDTHDTTGKIKLMRQTYYRQEENGDGAKPYNKSSAGARGCMNAGFNGVRLCEAERQVQHVVLLL